MLFPGNGVHSCARLSFTASILALRLIAHIIIGWLLLMWVLSSASSLDEVISRGVAGMLDTWPSALMIGTLTWLIMGNLYSFFDQNVVVKFIIYGLHFLSIKALVHVRVLVASCIT